MTDHPNRGPVQLFVTCIVDVFYPSVGRAVVRVLENDGFTVEFPQDHDVQLRLAIEALTEQMKDD